MKIVMLTFILLLIASPLFAKEEIIFTGIPDIKISEGGLSRIPEKLNKEKALEYKCTITKIDDKFYMFLQSPVSVEDQGPMCLATASKPEGPWEKYKENQPVAQRFHRADFDRG